MASTSRTMQVEAKSASRIVPLVTPVPRSSPPRLSVPARALIMDSLILLSAMTLYVVAMVKPASSTGVGTPQPRQRGLVSRGSCSSSSTAGMTRSTWELGPRSSSGSFPHP